MYISNNCDWRLNMNDIALLHEKLLGFGAYCLDHRLGEELLFVQP